MEDFKSVAASGCPAGMVSAGACGASGDQGGRERFAPFVISDADGLEGISVQIWEETASRLDLPFVYVPQPSSRPTSKR